MRGSYLDIKHMRNNQAILSFKVYDYNKIHKSVYEIEIGTISKWHNILKAERKKISMSLQLK